MTTHQHRDTVAQLEAEAATAEQAAAAARQQRDQARIAAEAERRDRRRELQRRELATAESDLWQAQVTNARATLGRAVRAEGPIGAVPALFALLVAEQRQRAASVRARGLRQDLGLPANAVKGLDDSAPYRTSALDTLARVLEAELDRQAAVDEQQYEARLATTWHGVDLPTVPRRLGTRAMELSGLIERLGGAIADLRTVVAQTPRGGLNDGQKIAAATARADLANLERRLAEAQTEFTALQHGLD